MKSHAIKNLVTIKAGDGKCVLLRPKSVQELQQHLKLLYRKKIKAMVIGNGSKLLFANGWSGVLVRLDKLDKITFLNKKLKIRCQAGVQLKDLVEYCVENGFAGIENLAGIPASLGGAVSVNAGAYGSSIGDIVDEVLVINERGNIKTIKRSKLKFVYRKSNIQGMIVEIVLGMKHGDPKELRRIADEFIIKRTNKLPKGYSAGCIFKNPKGQNMSAGKMIEECGLKGFKVGGARISTKHANFIINSKKATTEDILKLIEITGLAVKRKFGVVLEKELRVITQGRGEKAEQ